MQIYFLNLFLIFDVYSSDSKSNSKILHRSILKSTHCSPKEFKLKCKSKISSPQFITYSVTKKSSASRLFHVSHKHKFNFISLTAYKCDKKFRTSVCFLYFYHTLIFNSGTFFTFWSIIESCLKNQFFWPFTNLSVWPNSNLHKYHSITMKWIYVIVMVGYGRFGIEN